MRQFSSKLGANLRILNACQSCTQTAPSLYFWRILTIRTPYQRELFHKFGFSIQNQNPTTPVQSALFFKVQNQNWLLFDKFLSDFNDSGPILTRIVSRFWTYFRNQNPTIVTWTATILVCVIEFLCQTEQGAWTYCISTFCQLFSQNYVWNNYFWKLSIFVNSLNYPSMFSCAVLRASSLECRVAIFILHPVWVGAWALFNCRWSSF